LAIRKPQNSNIGIAAKAKVRFDISSNNIKAKSKPRITVRRATKGAKAGKGIKSTTLNKVTEAGNGTNNKAGISWATSGVIGIAREGQIAKERTPKLPEEEVLTRIRRKVVKKKVFEVGKN
jgi:hypothetical protein